MKLVLFLDQGRISVASLWDAGATIYVLLSISNIGSICLHSSVAREHLNANHSEIAK